MERLGITGKDTTPFLLARIAERTDGRSLAANIELVANNAKLAAEIATAL
jgi:pseudouridine-5'-phosphate glycosidase